MERKSWGFSLFCDDLRLEVGGKLSIMGTYQNDIIFPNDAPFVMQKFVILVKYFEETDAFKDDISIRVYLPGDQKDIPTVTFPVPRSNMQSSEPLYELEEDQERILTLTVPLMFAPLSVGKEGFLKVRAVCGDVVTNLGSLMVRKIKPDEIIPSHKT
jgi:hypothetical protein